MSLAVWFQSAAVQQATEPFTLTAIVFAFAGIAALFLINLTIKNDKKLSDLAREFKVHVAAETRWQEALSERHAGDYEHLLRSFAETRDAMMQTVAKSKPR